MKTASPCCIRSYDLSICLPWPTELHISLLAGVSKLANGVLTSTDWTGSHSMFCFARIFLCAAAVYSWTYRISIVRLQLIRVRSPLYGGRVSS